MFSVASVTDCYVVKSKPVWILFRTIWNKIFIRRESEGENKANSPAEEVISLKLKYSRVFSKWKFTPLKNVLHSTYPQKLEYDKQAAIRALGCYKVNSKIV